MEAVKTIFLVVAIISVPLVSIFLIRMILKIGRGLDHVNCTLDDIRPQLNTLFININHTVEDANSELEKVGQLTGESQEMLSRLDGSMRLVEEALRSPAARYAGMIAGFLTTAFLVRGILRSNGGRGTAKKRGK